MAQIETAGAAEQSCQTQKTIEEGSTKTGHQGLVAPEQDPGDSGCQRKSYGCESTRAKPNC